MCQLDRSNISLLVSLCLLRTLISETISFRQIFVRISLYFCLSPFLSLLLRRTSFSPFLFAILTIYRSLRRKFLVFAVAPNYSKDG